MSRRKKRMAPAANQDHSNNTTDAPSVPDHAALIDGIYVARVQIKGDHVPPRYRRRVFFGLAAGQRIVDKATMEGLDASLVLCRIVVVDGGGRHG